MNNLEAAIQNEDEAILTSSMTGMELFYPVMVIYEKGHIEYRVRLFDYNNFDRNPLVKILFEQFCTENGIQIQKKIRFAADMYIYRVSLDSLEKYQILEEFEGLYSVEKTSFWSRAGISKVNQMGFGVPIKAQDILYGFDVVFLRRMADDVVFSFSHLDFFAHILCYCI